jgi:cystinosin
MLLVNDAKQICKPWHLRCSPADTLRTTGLSPDFVWINPIGHLALGLWSFGAYFSSSARRQYAQRHDGAEPQVTKSDLAFSAHAVFFATVTLAQVLYYNHRQTRHSHSADAGSETARLLDTDTSKEVDGAEPTGPSVLTKVSLTGVILGAIVGIMMVWAGYVEMLDWLYYVSAVKLGISVVKYVPQVTLNYRLKSVEGFAVSVVVLVSVL